MVLLWAFRVIKNRLETVMNLMKRTTLMPLISNLLFCPAHLYYLYSGFIYNSKSENTIYSYNSPEQPFWITHYLTEGNFFCEWRMSHSHEEISCDKLNLRVDWNTFHKSQWLIHNWTYATETSFRNIIENFLNCA